MATMDLDFQDWKDKVDAALIATCGLPSDDLADCCYRDWFDSGTSPSDAAQMVLEENDFPEDE